MFAEDKGCAGLWPDRCSAARRIPDRQCLYCNNNRVGRNRIALPPHGIWVLPLTVFEGKHPAEALCD